MVSAPVIPGFHPDPSICRVGEDYFLATSSFEYFPGVPIFRSRDLVSWEQIGNALDRPEQLVVTPGYDGRSRGVYAPTIRFHDGRFWLITTNVDQYERGQLIVTADDPAGPWSDPVFVPEAVGIDPDLAWDEGGACHLTWKDKRNGGIGGALLDPERGVLLGPSTTLWRGSGLAHTEGPHRFRRGGYWYLVVAEGGTHAGHAVSIARSTQIDGHFEPHPQNPFFSHRSTADPVQAVGHADLVECADGSWAMVYLGIRPRGQFPGFHVNGRETFAARVEWEDDWPVVTEGIAGVDGASSFTDRFEGARLDPRWVAPGLDPATFARTGPDGLMLEAVEPAPDAAAGGVVAVRARDEEWTACVELGGGDLALTVRIDEVHWFGIEVRSGLATAKVRVAGLSTVLGESGGAPVSGVFLRAVSHRGNDNFTGPDTLHAGIIDADGETILGSFDGRYISTEVAGGFTGRMIGMQALSGRADIRSFSYSSGS